MKEVYNISPHVSDSEILENFACEIRNTGQRVRSPTNHWNPESRFHWLRLKSSTWNPESIAWNPESKTVLDPLYNTWIEREFARALVNALWGKKIRLFSIIISGPV